MRNTRGDLGGTAAAESVSDVRICPYPYPCPGPCPRPPPYAPARSSHPSGGVGDPHPPRSRPSRYTRSPGYPSSEAAIVPGRRRDRPRIHRDIRTRRRRGIRRRGIRRRTHIYRVRGPRAIADDARAGLLSVVARGDAVSQITEIGEGVVPRGSRGPRSRGRGTPWWWWYEGWAAAPRGPPSGRCTSALCMALGEGPPTSAPPTFHVCDPFGTSDTLGSSPLFSRRWLGRLIGLGAAMRPRETMRPTRWPPGLRASGRGVRIGAGRSGEFARHGLTARLGQRFEDRRRSSRARDLRGIAREAVVARGAAMRSEGVRESRAIDPRGVRRTWSSSRSTISTGRDP